MRLNCSAVSSRDAACWDLKKHNGTLVFHGFVWWYVSKSVALWRMHVSESVRFRHDHVSKSVIFRLFYVSKSVKRWDGLSCHTLLHAALSPTREHHEYAAIWSFPVMCLSGSCQVRVCQKANAAG